MDVIAMSSALVMSRTSTPPTRTAPAPASQNRAARRSTVDLPAPEGPTMAVTAPGSASKDTSRSTGLPCS